ncbi:uncharacterized protein LOC132393926 [Hypanus sabinus]|uniref:uncharacterized protein LOC132393926 n=1 Tax=Hypanus sabinus TaxID=79690 RepID=UPI0028C3818F|nr:uncharacterized protein LOC132393926 [Hypanus sabinus]
MESVESADLLDLNHTETGSGDYFQDNSWRYAFLVLAIIPLISLCVCLRFLCRKRDHTPLISTLRSILPDRRTRSNGTFRRNLLCQVECYGKGNVHLYIERKLNFSVLEKQDAPLVLFVYKVSRELEDLRNALQWIEGDRGRKKEEICAVILLEKFLNKWNKPVEVDHQGIFDDKTVVVRILWDAPNRIQESRSNKEAMDKVKRIIIEWNPAGGDCGFPDPPTIWET